MKLCARRGLAANGAKVLILGVAFKENCSDTRNSRVFDIASELQSFGAEVALYDPLVAAAHGDVVHGFALITPTPGSFDLALIAVAHKQFAQLGAVGIRTLLKTNGLIYDVKRLLATADSDGRL